MSELPEHTVRESTRGKHVRLRVSIHDGLVVVVPKGFDHAQIPGILLGRKRWLDRVMTELERRRGLMEPVDELPKRIALRAIGEDWTVERQEGATSSIPVTEHTDSRLLMRGGDRRTRSLASGVAPLGGRQSQATPRPMA